MPTTTNDGIELYYETAGSGDCVAFVGDCGFGAWQWAWQYDELAGPYETLVWDLRGTGRSDCPNGPYDVDQLASDLEAVLAANSVRRAHIVGAGLGGMVGLRYAREYTRGVTVSLFGAAPSGEDADIDQLRSLYPETRTSAALRESLTGAFSPDFFETDVVEQILEWRLAEDATPEGLDAQIAALQSFEAGPLYELTIPALVFHGLSDPVIDVEVGRELAANLPRGSFEAVEGRRLAHVEHARAIADRLAGFLDEHSSA